MTISSRYDCETRCLRLFWHMKMIYCKMMEDDGRWWKMMEYVLESHFKPGSSDRVIPFHPYSSSHILKLNLMCATVLTSRYDSRYRIPFVILICFDTVKSPPGFARHLQRFWWHPILQGISKTGPLWWCKIDRIMTILCGRRWCMLFILILFFPRHLFQVINLRENDSTFFPWHSEVL